MTPKKILRLCAAFTCSAALLATAGGARADAALDAAFDSLRAWNLGDAPDAPEQVISAIMASHGDAVARAAIASQLAGLLADGGTFEARKFACKHLYIVGTVAEVPALAPLLADPALADLARYALEKIPGPEATGALLAALHEAPPLVAAGIANSLGERRDPAATGALVALADHENAACSGAAIAALGKLGHAEALAALRARWPQAPEARRPALADALLACAGQAAPAEAATLYRDLLAQSGEYRVQAAAFHGLMSTDPEGRLALLVALLGGEAVAHPALAALRPEARQRLRVEAMAQVRDLPGDDATRAFTALLGAVDPATAAGLIHALADRGDSAAAPALVAALDAGDEAVRLAALEALGAVGTADAVDTLVAAAVSEDSAARQAARKSLERLPGDGVDDALVARLRQAEAPARAEIVRALAGRGSTGAVVPILRQARGKDAAVRDEAYRALAMLAGPGEVKDLLRLVERADTRGERDQAVKALVAAARRTAPGQQPAGPVLAALAEAQSPPVVEALTGALAGIGDPTALPELRARAVHPDPGLRASAVRAMADWPTDDTREELRNLAAWLPEPDERAAALDGYVRMLRADEGMDAKEKVDRYVAAMAAAVELGAKRRILAGLGDVSDAAALDALDHFAWDEALGTEARAVAEKVRRGFYTATASHASAEAAKAFDNNIDSRWTTGVVQAPGMWFELDLSRAAAIRGIVLDTTRSAGDFPRGYAVHVANEPGQWGAPVAEGQATTPVLEITFEPVRARYLRVVQTGESADHWWSIDELRVLPK